jgi:hypothetical protein
VAGATRRAQPQRTRPVSVNLGAQGLPGGLASPRFKRRAHLSQIPLAVVDRRHAPIGVSQQPLDQGLTADAQRLCDMSHSGPAQIVGRERR